MVNSQYVVVGLRAVVGPFLFSLGIMDIVKSMNTELNLWYLDDGSVAGDEESILECFTSIFNIVHSCLIGFE